MVPLIQVPDQIQANLICGILQSERISATLEGESLIDSWAVSQRVLGLLGTRVLVPAEDLERARAILESIPDMANQLADRLDDSEGASGDQPSG